QMALYRRVAGRQSYVAEECEQVEFGDAHVQRPFPYYTRSCTFIGNQLMAMGFIIRALQLPPGGRVLELGPGFGKLTIEMARSSFRVTAVDVNPLMTAVIAGQARREGAEIDLVCSGMLDYRPAERFERVVFFESFHHCGDHDAMVRRLDELVA